MRTRTTPYFEIRGRIGHDVVSATWSEGRLTADSELFDRAELLISSGEICRSDDSSRSVAAGLDTPHTALLTLIGCFDLVLKSEIMLGEDGDAFT